ncbi:SdrD B-like domain-containing protein [Mesorhizobium sp. P5_C1]
MTTFTISDQATLNAAITAIAGRAGTDIFNFTTSFTLSGNMTSLFLTAGENLTINGNGQTIDGANTYGGFVIEHGTVAINDLDIVHTTARGGTGGVWQGNGSGGGAGLGGGLFVGAGANVTISNVDFTGDRAIGGNGGGISSTFANGGLWNGFLNDGTGFGAGGIGGTGSGPGGSGASGGFGAGGGAATPSAGAPNVPGNGGWGAGGGGVGSFSHAGYAGGGGGLGAGGAIFVDTLGTLTIAGGTISGGAVQGGAAGPNQGIGVQGGGGGGSAGSGIFLHGTTINFATALGQISTINDVIQDGDGIGGIVMKGAGTLQLGGANGFAGGITVYSGTLSLANTTAAGSGAINFFGHGALQLASGVNIANQLKNFGTSDTISLLGFGSATGVSYDSGTHILTITRASGGSEILQLDVTHSYLGNHFVTSTDVNGNTTIAISNLLADGDFQFIDLSDTGPGVSIDHTAGNTVAGVLTGWTGIGSFGAFAPTSAVSTGFAGSNIGFLGNGSSVSQTVNAPGNFDSYSVAFDLGSRADTGNGTTVRVQVFAGGIQIASQDYDTSSAVQAHGSVAHYVLNTAALDATTRGLAVKVLITEIGTGQTLFDNVVLTGIDTTTPVVTNHLQTDTGISSIDTLTNVATLTGTGDANAIVHFTVDGTLVGQTATANAAGVWTFTPTGLLNGPHTIIASETDDAGNTGTSSTTFTLDTTLPAVTNHLQTDTGISGADTITNVATLTGSGDANAIVHFTVDGNPIAQTATANGAGVWTFAPTGLLDGQHTIVATQTDNAGNTGTASLTFTLDTTLPAVTNHLQTDTGVSGSDTITNVATLTGTGDANAIVHFTVDGNAVAGTATANGAGAWAFTPTGLLDGQHTIVASQTDAAGNTATSSLDFTLDTSAPTLTISSDSDQIHAGESATITFTFSEDPGSTFAWDGTTGDVTVSGGTLSAITGTGLTRTAIFTTNAVHGSIGVAGATYTDAAGNPGGAGNALALTGLDHNMISGTAFDDKNGNGINDDGAVLGGITVHLLGTDHLGNAVDVSTTTGLDGGYSFTDIVDGAYSVQFDADGHIFSPANQGGDAALDSDVNSLGIAPTIVLVENADISNVDAGMAVPATVGDFVFNDINLNGRQDAGEVGIAGVSVSLVDTSAAHNILATATTDANGHYDFTNLLPGSYQLQFTAPSGYVLTTQDSPVSNDATDSDVSESTGLTGAFSLIDGQNDTSRDAGMYALPTFAGLDGDAATFTEDEPAVRLDTGTAASLADADGTVFYTYDSNNLAQPEHLTVSITGGGTAAEDVLGFDTSGDVSLSDGLTAGSVVTVGGVTVGTITAGGDGQNGHDLTVTLDLSLNNANFETLLHALTYSNSNGADPSAADRTVTVSFDGDLQTHTATTTVHVSAVNDAPVAANDSYNASEDTQLTIAASGLLANDSDADHDPLTALLVNGPSHGVLTLNADGSLSYTADANYNGADSFTYKVGDGTTTSDVATVSINVAAVDDPGLAAVDSFSTNEATAIGPGFNVFADNGDGIDVDIDNPLSVAAVNGVAGNVGTEITLASGALLTLNADGTFDYDPNGVFNDLPGPSSGASNTTATDSFTYTLAGGSIGTVTIAVHGVDGDGDNLIGTAGADTLNGGIGADTMHGLAGNDIYTVDNAGDQVFEAAGEGTYDTVRTSVSYALAAGQQIETLATDNVAATTAITLTGNEFAQTIIGNAGANIIDGLGGADTMQGGLGNDTYTVDNAGNQVIEANGQGTDSVFSSVSFNLFGQEIEALTLTGTGSINGTGNQLANTITGNSGDNVIDGLGGADTMQGGTGNDSYYVDNAGDRVFELNGQGTDSVFSSVSFNLSGQELENLTLLGAASIDGTGNSTANVLTGNSGANTLIGLGGNDTLDGKAGADTMQGGVGNDIYYVDNAGDHIIEANGQGTDSVFSSVSFNLSGQELENLTLLGAANLDGTGNSTGNFLTGNAGANTLFGLGGNDTLDGMAGADTMQGGLGNDTYFVDNIGDHVIELNGQGFDTVNSAISFNLSGQELENLMLLGTGNINGTGNSTINDITGNSGNNILDGLVGADTMRGGLGNDTYFVDNIGDHIFELNGQGTDSVFSSVSFNLSGQELENLTLTGTSNLNGTGNSTGNTLTGNAGANTLFGLGGNDTLDGKAGADMMQGGTGNDIYFVDNAGDRAIELDGQGTDTVNSSVSFNLSGQELENLNLRSGASINGTGNHIDNVITGNSGDNIINGLSGNDTLTGALGHDSFLFTTALSLVVNVDTITDFSVVDDTIVLDHAIFAALAGNGTLSADQFTANASGTATDANQHIIYETDTGWLYYDSNGDAAGGSKHFATVAANLAMTNADFVVV